LKIKSIKRKKYKGYIYDLTLLNDNNPYFYANGILSHNSLYPHIMIQCNLYGRKRDGVINDRPVWYGNGKWKVDGAYYSDEMAGVGVLLKTWYYTRLFYKRKFIVVETNEEAGMEDIEKYIGKEIYHVASTNDKNEIVKITVTDRTVNKYKELVAQGIDRREYTIKIILNTVYGILNHSYYTKVFDITAGGDCTRIGRQWTKYARKVFRDNGYKVLYTDTDSVYISDPFNNKEKMFKVKDQIIKDIKDTVPFQQETFDMGIDDEIKYMFFFKGGNKKIDDEDEDEDEDDKLNKRLGFMKKNYIYVTKSGKVKIKNLGVNKKSITPVTKKIFWEYLVPQIKEKGEVKFSKRYLKDLIKKLLTENIELACMRKVVGDISLYKNSMTGIQAQISQKYGAGIHFLIPNIRDVGIGKGVKLCTLEEFKKRNFTLDDIDYKNIWSELEYFIKPVVTKSIFDY